MVGETQPVVVAATVIASNYLAHLRVLEASLHRHHPRARLVALVVDGEPAVDGVEVLTPCDVGIDDAELHRRALLYELQGVVSSLRWPLLRHLLGDAPVLLLDADMLVLATLDDVWALAARAGVLLSPHAHVPIAGRPGAWPEEELLRSGTFSGGFVGVGPQAAPFVDWMAERTARDCLRVPERGLLYGQTWLNLVPALFAYHILRDPGVNTQVHALGGRDVTFSADVDADAGGEADADAVAVVLGDTPVRLFHFAGFDPATPDRLCRHYEQGQLDDQPGVARLCREYAGALVAAGWPAAGARRWVALPGATPVDEVMRAAYRAALLDGEDPPDPFDAADPEAFMTWLRTPPPGEVVPRYLLWLHRLRGDLRAAFASVSVIDAPEYLKWAARKAAEPGQTEIPPQLFPAARDPDDGPERVSAPTAPS